MERLRFERSENPFSYYTMHSDPLFRHFLKKITIVRISSYCIFSILQKNIEKQSRALWTPRILQWFVPYALEILLLELAARESRLKKCGHIRELAERNALEASNFTLFSTPRPKLFVFYNDEYIIRFVFVLLFLLISVATSSPNYGLHSSSGIFCGIYLRQN